MTNDKKGKRVLCVACKKPIHISEWGAITKEGFWHNNIFCLLAFIRMEEERKFTPEAKG